MRLTKTDFGPEVFATDAEEGDFPTNFPLSYKQLAYAQGKDRKIQASLKTKAGKEKFVMKTFRHLDKSYELVTKDDKIVIPTSLQRKASYRMVPHPLAPSWRNAFRINAQATFHVRWAEAYVRQSLQGMPGLQNAQEEQQELRRTSS
jgi:hypothetical protein